MYRAEFLGQVFQDLPILAKRSGGNNREYNLPSTEFGYCVPIPPSPYYPPPESWPIDAWYGLTRVTICCCCCWFCTLGGQFPSCISSWFLFTRLLPILLLPVQGLNYSVREIVGRCVISSVAHFSVSRLGKREMSVREIFRGFWVWFHLWWPSIW